MTALTAYALFVAVAGAALLWVARQARIATGEAQARIAAAQLEFEREFGLAISRAGEPIEAPAAR